MTEQLQLRTKQLALRIIRPAAAFPTDTVGQVLGRQLLRRGTSAGANYRAVRRAQSPADMIHKLRLLRKRPAKPCIGWSYWLKVGWFRKRVWPI
jgi:hypothetical protein